MPRKLVVVPTNMGSRSARELARVLSTKVGHRVWRVAPADIKGRVAFKLREGTDKLTQFRRFQDAQVSAPDHTTDIAVAREWVTQGPVVCRTLLRGSEGRGIVVAETVDQVVAAPLYTRYVKKKKEFRVHVLHGEVIDVQEKRRRSEFDGERDTRIRNVANGYVFCRGNITEPADLRANAIAAVAALGYTLGAVDIVYNERSNSLYVLEVNSTPGMEGTTVENYANKIADWYRSQA
jgi:glutathione synthase/RimK-type ligase-like ATP-grasp enzyme